MNTYKKNKIKDSILKNLPMTDDYQVIPKGSRTNEEWYLYCALVQEMINEGYIRGMINLGNPDIEIFITPKSILFRNGGGYVKQYHKKIRSYIITITISIVTLIVAILTLLKN